MIANAVCALAPSAVTTSHGIDMRKDHSRNGRIFGSDANPSIRSSPTLNNNLIQLSSFNKMYQANACSTVMQLTHNQRRKIKQEKMKDVNQLSSRLII